MAANIVVQRPIYKWCLEKKARGLPAVPSFEMAGECWLLAVVLALWSGSKATCLAVNNEEKKMEIEATYSRIQEPNDKTYYKMDGKHKTWCNQCMSGTNKKRRSQRDGRWQRYTY